MNIKDLYALYKEHPQVTTDSRDCPKGSIFLALKGTTFNGNKFAKSALDKGCAYAIIDEPEYADPADSRLILVDDALVTYKELAREHRRQFSIPVIGITGTNGKTTTKELIAAVLGEKYNVMYTQANYNNDVGVPKTLFTLNASHDIAVVEMGASHPGDIKRLVDYVEPTCGLVTNVGRAHLLGFGSFKGVKDTKGELYDFLAAHQAEVFLNSDSEDLREMAAQRGITRSINYGTTPEAEVRGELTGCDPTLRFRWRGSEISTQLIGAYNLHNMLAAIAVGLRFGVTEEQIRHALESYTPRNNRSQLMETAHNRLIVDAYNANPTSMAAAIDNFRTMDSTRDKMAILGEMGELGEVSHEEHQRVVNLLRDSGLNQVWLVGKEFAAIECPYRKFATVDEVKQALETERPEGMDILVKGSHSTRLYELPPLL